MTQTLEEMLAWATAHAPAPDAGDAQRANRSRATCAGRTRKREKKQAVLAECDGDTESLKTIHYWIPSQRSERLLARGYEKKFVGPQPDEVSSGDDELHDEPRKRAIVSINPAEFDQEVTVESWEMIEETIKRAGPPSLEIDLAKFEGRFQKEPSFYSRFYNNNQPNPQVACNYARPTHLGDFEWADDKVPHAERQAIHARNARHLKRGWNNARLNSGLASAETRAVNPQEV